MQRRMALLRGTIKHSKNELDEIKDGVKELESYSTTCLAKTDGSKKTTNGQVQCNGCKHVDDAVVSMRNFCDDMKELKSNKMDQSQKLTANDAKELITRHKVDCLLNAFVKAGGTFGSAKGKSIRESSDIAQDYIQLLKQEHKDAAMQNLALVEERRRLENAVDEVANGLVESILHHVADSTDDLKKVLSEWIKMQLTVAGLTGALESAKISHDRRSAESDKAWKKENEELKTDLQQMEKKYSQLDELNLMIGKELIQAQNAVKTLIGKKKECQKVLLDFIANCQKLNSIGNRLALSVDANEKCGDLLNGVKAIDTFRTVCSSGENGQLFVPQGDMANSSVRRAMPPHIIDHVINGMWGCFVDEGIEGIRSYLADLQDKETEFNDGPVAELLAKLEPFEEKVSALQAALQKLSQTYVEWVLEQSKGACAK